ncbi:MAG: TipAS antibiotic-recognition domain-containing protein [Chloroflexota bacterium]
MSSACLVRRLAPIPARCGGGAARTAPASTRSSGTIAQGHRRQIDDAFYECSYEMHVGLAEMYVADPRFTATYEKIAPGLAQYLHDAIKANAARQGG